MAEHLARKMLGEMGLGDLIRVRSAGIFASSSGRIPENTILVLRKEGITLDKHITTPLDGKMVNEADLILAMDLHHIDEILNRFPSAASKVFLFKEFAGLGRDGIIDPIGCSFEAYETCLSQIRMALPSIIKRIKEGGYRWSIR